MDNLRIWSAVEKTDPSETKAFNRGGGFKGTATNPTYLAEKATRIWGPYGIGWGMDLLSSEFREGHVFDELGNREVIHIELWRLWYMDGETRGEVSHYGQTTFVGKNKYGAFTDEEAPKKTKTDAMTKCLALLGFSADIHRGRFDDVKYVNDRRREEDAAKADDTHAETRDRIKAALSAKTTPIQLEALWKHKATVAAFDSLPEPMKAELQRAYTDAMGKVAA